MNARLSSLVTLLGALAFVVTFACTPAAQNLPNDNGTPADETAGSDPNQTADTGNDGTADAGNDGTTNDDTTAEGKLTFTMRADFATSVRGVGVADELSGDPIPTIGCPDPLPTQDYPGLPAGNDCDGDDATVQYITPTVFRVAVKRLVLLDDQGGTVEIVPDTAKLAAAQLIDLTAPATLADAKVPAGHYTQIQAELYYYELVMPMNGAPTDQGLRLYLSDDDFASEDSLGHHQGDITLIDPNGAELGFVVEGAAWTVDELAPQHQDMVYAGSNDPETGHRRGPFGDTDLWNAEPYMQGATQDIYVLNQAIDLELTPTGATITVVFDVGNSWYYEDYENDGSFTPCGHGQGNPGDACFEGGGWAAVFPAPRVLLDSAPAEVVTAKDIK